MARPETRPSAKLAVKKGKRAEFCVRSLPIDRWPVADRTAWEDACRSGFRLKRGGTASHLSEAARRMYRQRYSYFLEYVLRTGQLNDQAEGGAHVVPANVDAYLERLRGGVSSVTAYNSIRMLRRAAQLVAPGRDYSWLMEIEKDLAFVMTPRSKQDRLVMTEVLVEAGLTLFAEAEAAGHRSQLDRACMARNGLMIALLSIFPFRLKNFAALEIGRTFVNLNGFWWFVLPAAETKERSQDERRVHEFLKPFVDRYVEHYRPVLGREKELTTALWLSWRDGSPLSYFSIEPIITATTRSAIGVGISPHMFRSAVATSAAVHRGDMPYLASALLHHRDPRVANQSYNRATTFQAAEAFSRMVAGFCSGSRSGQTNDRPN